MILKNAFYLFMILGLFSCSDSEKPDIAQKIKLDISEIDETIKTIDDPVLLFNKFRQLAEHGNSEAMIELSSGYIYDENLRSFDSKKAMQWLAKAAQQGNPHASFELAEIYADGLSDAQGNLKINGNIETSLMWVYIGNNQIKRLKKLEIDIYEVELTKVSNLSVQRAKKRADDWLKDHSI